MNKISLNWAQDCWNEFNGTQEQLDEIVQILTDMAETGELLEAKEIDDNDAEEFTVFYVEIPKRILH